MQFSALKFPLVHSEQPCALCGSHDAFVIGAKDRDGQPLRTVISEKSGLVWTDPRPASREIDAFYSQLYRLSYKGAGAWRPKAKHIYRCGRGARARHELWKDFLAPCRDTLDIGASAGEMVYLLKKLGKNARGIEPNESYVQWARKELSVDIEAATWKNAVFPEASFDAITSFHVFEHLEDPLGAMRRVAHWLRVGGVAIIEVPNVAGTCDNPLRRFHFAHLYNFNEATMQMLGRKAGLEVATSVVTPDTAALTVVFRKSEIPAPEPAGEIPGNCARIMSVLMDYTFCRHLFAPRTWRRFARKHFRSVHEKIAEKRHGAGRALLDAAIDS